MTKHFILTILTSLLLLSCQTSDVKTNEPVQFDFVDFTLFHHFTTTSVHIDSIKNVYVCHAWGKDRDRFYKGTLDKKDQGKLDSLLRIILKSQRDTAIGTPVPDGTAYRIVFKSKDKKITVTNWSDTCCRTIDRLVFSVNKQVEIFKTPFADTNFFFPSRDIIPKAVMMSNTTNLNDKP